MFSLFGDRVAVVVDNVPEVHESGLYVPDSGQSWERYGTIVGIGRGTYSERNDVYVQPPFFDGDRVFFHRQAGTKFEHGGSEYLILSSTDIVGIVEDDREDAP